jgi:hypothetical protein
MPLNLGHPFLRGDYQKLIIISPGPPLENGGKKTCLCNVTIFMKQTISYSGLADLAGLALVLAGVCLLSCFSHFAASLASGLLG